MVESDASWGGGPQVLKKEEEDRDRAVEEKQKKMAEIVAKIAGKLGKPAKKKNKAEAELAKVTRGNVLFFCNLSTKIDAWYLAHQRRPHPWDPPSPRWP